MLQSRRLMYTQRRFDSKPSSRTAPWRIDWEFPEALQFWSYVGQIHDFRLDATIGSKITPLKREWMEWWKQLLSDFASKAARSSAAPTSPVDAFEALSHEPPLFPELADLPHLQAACREHWPHFNQVWNGQGGGQRQLNQQLSQLLHQLDLNDLVQKCMHLTGKSGSIAFSLRIGILRWPEEYKQHVSKECLMIGAAYLEQERQQSVISMLQSQLCELIRD